MTRVAEIRLWHLLLLVAVLVPLATGFVAPSPRTARLHSSLVLQAKKKGKKGGAKGFAKDAPKPAPSSSSSSSKSPAPAETSPSPEMDPSFLQSVEQGGSDNIPKMQETDSDLSPEERAKKLLREQYGLRTLAEQRREDQIQERKNKMEEMKALAEKDEAFDIMAVLPAPLLKGIDAFLKLGLGVCTVLFVLAGLGITAEAWSKATDSPLPENIDNFIVTVVEPNFTPGLLVLLGFSISLGAFAALQLSSSSATYKEE